MSDLLPFKIIFLVLVCLGAGVLFGASIEKIHCIYEIETQRVSYAD